MENTSITEASSPLMSAITSESTFPKEEGAEKYLGVYEAIELVKIKLNELNIIVEYAGVNFIEKTVRFYYNLTNSQRTTLTGDDLQMMTDILSPGQKFYDCTRGAYGSAKDGRYSIEFAVKT